MKNFKLIAVSVLFAFASVSCSTIVNGTSQRVSIQSRPNSSIVVKDTYGKVVQKGVGSLDIDLKRGLSFGNGARYTITSNGESKVLEPQLYIGAFIVGNLFTPITWLGHIVDLATGGAFELRTNNGEVNSIEFK